MSYLAYYRKAQFADRDVEWIKIACWNRCFGAKLMRVQFCATISYNKGTKENAMVNLHKTMIDHLFYERCFKIITHTEIKW